MLIINIFKLLMLVFHGEIVFEMYVRIVFYEILDSECIICNF